MIAFYSVSIVSLGILFLYAMFISSNKKWREEPMLELQRGKNTVSFSILIAFRNEEDNLPLLIASLSKLDYPKDLLEVIFIDDASNDNSVLLVQEFDSTGICSTQLIQSDGGKKKAIHKGILKAKHDYILTTDADCVLSPKILQAYASEISKSKAKFIAGPVIFHSHNTLQKVFALEFAALQSSTAVAISNGKAIMSNGANLCFEREVYEDMTSLEPNVASGEDVFLMTSVKSKYGSSSISYCKSQETCVYTNPPTNLSAYFAQRIRWTSKSRFYKDKDIIISALLVLAVHMALVTPFVLSAILGLEYMYLGLFILLSKLIVDSLAVQSFLSFSGQKKLNTYMLITFFFTTIATPLIALLGQFVKVKWKGRRI